MAGRNPALEALRNEPARIVFVDCAHTDCRSPAVCRVKRPQGWANLCDFHYTRDNLYESQQYCEKHGLDTIEKKVAHYKQLFKKPRDPRAWMKSPKSALARRYADEVMRIAPPEREPGEDLEEMEVSI